MTAFHPSDLILIGGHPGVGKTTFMVSLARNIAYKKIKQRYSVRERQRSIFKISSGHGKRMFRCSIYKVQILQQTSRI